MSPRSTPARARRSGAHSFRKRFLALTLTGLLGALQLADLVHQLITEHQYCPEHGALVHAPAHPDQRATTALAGEEAGAASLGFHNHGCGYLGVAATADGQRVDLAQAPCVAASEGEMPDLWTSSALILHYAPKLSPPAAHPRTIVS